MTAASASGGFLTREEGSPRIGAMKPLLPPCGRSAGLALALLLACSAAHAERSAVYRWFDESGVAHYTTQKDRIPREARDRVEEVGRSAAPSPQPARSDTAAGAATASPPAAAPATALPPAAPPSVAAPPPSGPRVMPEGDFEEPPLGAHAPGASATRPQAAPAAATASPAVARPAAPATPAVSAAPPRAPAAVAPSADRAPAPEPAPLDPAALDDRISALEEQVGRDEAALQDLLSQPRVDGAPRLADRTDFREIAQRLPKLQAELGALRQQRTRQGL